MRRASRWLRCYHAAPPLGFPCPDDVRGVAGREAWPLPGLRILRADAISRTFCGVVKGDAVHTRHNHPLLARMLFAMLEFL